MLRQNNHDALLDYSEEERHSLLSSKSCIYSHMVELITSENSIKRMNWTFESHLIGAFPFLELLIKVLISNNNYLALSVLSFDIDCYKYIQKHAQSLCSALLNDGDIIKQLDSLVLLLRLTDEQIIDERSMINLVKSVASNLPNDLTSLRYLSRLIDGTVVEQSGLVKFLFGALIETSNRSVAIDLLKTLEYIYCNRSISIEVLCRSKVMNSLFRWLHGRGAEIYWSLRVISSVMQVLKNNGDVETRKLFLRNVIPEVELLFDDIDVLVECVHVYPEVVLLVHSVLNGHVVSEAYDSKILQYMKSVCDEFTARIYAVYVDLCSGVKIDRDVFSGVYQWLATDKSMGSIVNRLFGRVFNCSLRLTFHQKLERDEHVDYSALLEVSSKGTRVQEERVLEYEQRLKELQDEVISRNQLVMELQNSLNQMGTEVTLHLQTSKEQETSIDTLKHTIEDYEERLCEQEATSKALIDKLVQDQQMDSIVILDLQNQVSTLNAHIIHKNNVLEEFGIECNAVKSKLTETNVELETLHTTKLSLESQLEAMNRNMEEERKTHVNLIRDARQKTHLERLRLQHELDDLTLSSKQQTEELDALRSEVHTLRASEMNHNTDLGKLRMQLEVKEEQLRRDRLEMERLLAGDPDGMFE